MENWPYAIKVVEMSAAGGPDAYDAMLLESGYSAGHKDGYSEGWSDRASDDAIKMLVIGGVTALVGGIGTLVTHLAHRRREKRQQDKIERLEVELRDRHTMAVENNISIRFELPAVKCLPAPTA